MPRMPRKKRLRHVAVLIESSRGYGRSLLQGVARYSREHGSWTMYFEPRALDTRPPPWLKDWRGDGILARITRPHMVEVLAGTGLPVIDLRGPSSHSPFLRILPDNTRIAQLTFEHLYGRGFRNFAFYGRPRGTHHNQDHRCDAFRHQVTSAGLSCPTFHLQQGAAEWEWEQEQLTGWLHTLPKAVGIFTGDDDYGFHLLDACRRAGLQVPEEVAVVGVDNDVVLCNTSIPTMSSFDTGAERVGYVAAGWLDRLMNGRKAPSGIIWVQPSGLVARRSTDVFAFDDADVTKALRFIHAHAAEGIRVTDIVKEVALSQSVLERRFQRLLGRNPKTEICRVQIEQVKQLLRETDLSLAVIARRTGFSSENYLSDAFFRYCGIRPSEYHKLHRATNRW